MSERFHEAARKGSERFHEAARKGDTGTLKVGTWKDYDRSDEKGMSPAMWAAASGHIEALKILVEKGASVNRCDYFGRTALHHAAGNGHVGCVVFLIEFGVNIWSLDNNFNTPLDVAAIHNRMTVVNCLDKAAAHQMSTDVRTVKKQRESAIRDAERRAKRFQRSQQEMEVVAGNDGMRLSSNRSFPSGGGGGTRSGMSPSSYVSLTLSSRLSGRTAVSELRPYSSQFDNDSTPNAGSNNAESGSPPFVKSASLLSLFTKRLQRKPRQFPGSASASKNSSVESKQTERAPRKPVGSLFGLPFNGIQETEETTEVRPSTPLRTTSQPELSVHQGVRNLGMDELEVTSMATQHQHQGMDPRITPDIQPSLESKVEEKGNPHYDEGNANDLRLKNGSVGNRVNDQERSRELGSKGENGWEDREKGPTAGRFNASDNRKRMETMDGESRPQNGGSNHRDVSGNVETERRISNLEKFEGLNGRFRPETERYSNYPVRYEIRSRPGNGWWIDDCARPGKNRSESRLGVDGGTSTLDTFLQTYGLLDYVPVLAREKLDMNSLTLVTDLDLKDLGIPLGPRRVLLDAVARRRTALANPGRITDSTF